MEVILNEESEIKAVMNFGLANLSFHLKLRITDIRINRISEETIKSLNDCNNYVVATLTSEDMKNLNQFYSPYKSSMSIADASSILYSKTYSIPLITDNNYIQQVCQECNAICYSTSWLTYSLVNSFIFWSPDFFKELKINTN